jgi:hypothetical protein
MRFLIGPLPVRYGGMGRAMRAALRMLSLNFRDKVDPSRQQRVFGLEVV